MLCKEKTACFTGHRELKEPFEVVYAKTVEVVEKLIHQGYKFFGAGGARGFDALAAEVVLELKAKYPHIHLILVLPFYKQYEHEKNWKTAEIAQHEKHKKLASKVVYTQEVYSSGCYYKRNRHLVDFSSICIAYQYKSTGGTAYTTKYATEKGVYVEHIV